MHRAAILTLRLYAFTGGKKYLVVLVFACFVAIAVYHTWVVFAKALREYKHLRPFYLSLRTAKSIHWATPANRSKLAIQTTSE